MVDICQATLGAPDSLNADAYAAWLFRIKLADAAEVAQQLGVLLDADAYVATL